MSRREVIGAAAVIPFLPLDGGGQVGVEVGLGADSASQGSASESTPTLPSPIEGEDSSGDWDCVLAAYRAAEGAVAEAGRGCSAGGSRADVFAAEDAYGDRVEEMYERLRELLTLPAPDLAALLVKVELAFEHEIATLERTGPCVAAVRADVRRLAGVAASL